MRRLRKFLQLPFAERRLLLRAFFWLGAARLGLRLLSFRVLQEWLDRVARTGWRPAAPCSLDRVSWAIRVAGQYVPGGDCCLPQALAAKVLLKREGFPASLHIGVTRNGEFQFQAHAWVESQRKIVTGGLEVDSYSPLVVWEGEKP